MSRRKGGGVASFYYSVDSCHYRVFYRPERGMWYAYKQGGGRQRIALGAKSKAEATAALDRIHAPTVPASTQVAQANGNAPGVSGLSILEANDLFLRHREINKGRAKRTLVVYRNVLKRFADYCKGRGITRIDQITLSELEGFQEFRARKDKCAPNTVWNNAVVIKTFLKFLAHPARKHISDNPALAWELERPPQVTRYCYTQEEVDAMIQACRGWLKPVITTLAYTGMRIGELIELRREDVDLAKDVITLRVREDWKPKGKRSRVIPMHPLVEEVIKTQPKGDYVFRGPRGGKLKECHVLQQLKKDRAPLGISADSGLHSFRHFFVSLCANNGTPINICMSWVGHKDSAMIRYYYHLSDEVSKEAMASLARKSGTNRRLSVQGDTVLTP